MAAWVESRSVDSLSLVGFDSNMDSVPTEFAHNRVTVIGTVDHISIAVGDRTVAAPGRC